MVAGLWRLLQGVVLLFVAYTWAPVVVRVVGRRRFDAMVRGDQALPAPRTTRLLVLVPAHNEAAVIGRLMASLAGQTYPRDRFRVVVVSDNSTDATARIVRDAGFTAYERTSKGPSNKGQALGWLWARLLEAGPEGCPLAGVADAVVIVDADCVAEPAFLAELDRAFAGGVQVVQGYRSVEGLGTSALVDLEAAMEEIRQQCLCGVRRLLGLSAYILGSGVAFRADLFDRLMRREAVVDSITEDQSWQDWLIDHGYRITWWPSARLRYETVATMGEFRKQRNRWVGDRIRTMTHGLPNLARGVAAGDPVRIDQGLYRLQPPRSVLIALSCLCVPAAWLFPRASLLRWPAWAGTVAGYGLYLLAGFLPLRAPWRSYRSLLSLPAVVGQITWISLLTLVGRTTRRWEAVQHGAAGGERSSADKGRGSSSQLGAAP